MCYAQGDTEQALTLYNQSLQFAPVEDDEDGDNNTKDLAVTYANRSAVWVDKEEFFLAIRDADFAFEANYPKELHYKLFERKAQCQLALGLTEEASQVERTVNDLFGGGGAGSTHDSWVKPTIGGRRPIAGGVRRGR